MNSVVLVGNLTRNPELRQTQSGIAVCNFTVAVNRRANANGEKIADFIPVVAWRTQAEACAKYLAKGRKVAVHGMLQSRLYDAEDGGKRYVMDVIADSVEFLGSGQSGQSSQTDGGGSALGTPVDDDDLPFRS